MKKYRAFDDLCDSEIEIIDGRLQYFSQIMDEATAWQLKESLCRNVNWRQDTIKIAGKVIPLPRLQAWFADPGLTYTYSSIKLQPAAWLADLAWVRDQVTQISGYAFNSVLLSRYRDGSDSMGWHSDDEPELGENPVIASLSLGQIRRFLLRHDNDDVKDIEIPLEHNSLLLMSGSLQHNWRHSIPKTKRPVGERINLTFRKIITQN